MIDLLDDAIIVAIPLLYFRLVLRMVRFTRSWDELSLALVFQFMVMGSVWAFFAALAIFSSHFPLWITNPVVWSLRVLLVVALVWTNYALRRSDLQHDSPHDTIRPTGGDPCDGPS